MRPAGAGEILRAKNDRDGKISGEESVKKGINRKTPKCYPPSTKNP